MTNDQTPDTSHERVEQWLAAGRNEDLEALLDSLHPSDIALLLGDLDPEQAAAVFALLADPVASEVLDETHGLVREQLLEHIEPTRLARLLNILPEDDAADFLAALPPSSTARLLSMMDDAEAQKVRRLLGYAEGTAGRLMTGEVAVLRLGWSVAQALDYLRRLGTDAETLYYLYVVDELGKLAGVVPLRALLLASADAPIESLTRRDLITIQAGADREELAELIARYDFVALPVVDRGQRLLGVVTVDDALDVIKEEATEDIQRLGGSEPLEASYFSTSIPRIAAKRIVWLLPLFAASVLTDAVIDSYQGLLSQIVMLAVFIPVVSGTAGNAGSQTVATIIRALGTGDVRLIDAGRAWMREATVAVLLGVCLAIAGYFRAVWVGAGPSIAVVLALTLPAVILLANTLATLVPLIAEKIGIDPAVVSTPMIATLVDAIGILIYLTLAAYLLTG